MMHVWKYSILVFLGGCSYGVVSTFVKLAYRSGFSVAEVTASQYICGAVLSWLIAVFVPKIRLSAKQGLTVVASGIPMGLTGIFYNNCLDYIDASLAIVLLLQFTWIHAGIQFLLDKKMPSRKNIFAIVVILLGSVFASGAIDSNFNGAWKGVAWGLLAATSFASFLHISGRVATELHPFYKSAIMTTGAVITVCLVMPPVFLVQQGLGSGVMVYGLFTGLFGSVLPSVLFNIGMPKVRSLGSILSASELPMAVLMSTLVLHETVTVLQWMGVVLILGGIAYPNLDKRQLASS